MVPTLTPAFIIPEGIGGGISGGGGSVATTAAGVVAAGVIVGGLAVVAAPVVGALAAKAAVLTTAGGPGLLAIGAFLKGLEQLRDWGWLNWRPPTSTDPAPLGTRVDFKTGGDDGFLLVYSTQQVQTGKVQCSNGESQPDSFGSVTQILQNSWGVGITIESTGFPSNNLCGPGTNIGNTTKTAVRIHRANGSSVVGLTVTGGGTQYNQSVSNVNDFKLTGISARYQGVDYAPVIASPGTFPNDSVRPQLFPQTLPDAPTLPAPPLREPLQTPTLPPPPDRRPLAPPVTIPRPGQQPARVPVPGPRPGPAPGPGTSPTPSQPAPAGVPAIGPLPLPIPLPVPTTPGSVVIVDGQPIGGPGQAPAPNLVAIATELGRLERKNEILLSRPENGGAGPLVDGTILGAMRTALERLITELLNDVPPGSFTLAHACPPPGGGDPLPPVVVPYEGGGNPTAGILAKMDGLAALIQAHKTMRQPMCRTPLVGEEVTIHFESDG